LLRSVVIHRSQRGQGSWHGPERGCELMGDVLVTAEEITQNLNAWE
jgi:hypothetical protein